MGDSAPGSDSNFNDDISVFTVYFHEQAQP